MIALQIFLLSCCLTVLATAAPQEFGKAENIIKNGCVCGRTLYAKDFEARRLAALNSCVEEIFGADKTYEGAEPITAECPQAAILALQNLRKFSDWKTSTFDEAERAELDSCFYGKLGFRKPDGSSNPSALMEEIKKAQLSERDRGLLSLKKANREADPEKKRSYMEKFNDSTFAYKFLTHLANRARDNSVCDQSNVSQHYRCTFNDCFAASAGNLAI